MMQTDLIQMRLVVSREMVDLIEGLAAEEGVSETEIVRRGLAVMKAFKVQKKRGRRHLGFVMDPEKLDAEIVGMLKS
jgi:hypothetical protein